MKTIKLPYSPSITKEYIMDVLMQDYPDKKVSKFLNQIRIKQNSLRVAQILVIHNEKKNFTQISVSATNPLWVSGTIIIPILFIILASYSLFGNWATEVTEKLKIRVEKPREFEESKDLKTEKTASAESQRVNNNKKVNFAKFADINIE